MDLEGGRQAIHTETKKQEINTFLCSYGVELLNLDTRSISCSQINKSNRS